VRDVFVTRRFIGTAVALVLLAAACGGGGDDSAEEAPDEAVQQGGSLVLAGEQIPSGLNAQNSVDNAFWTGLWMDFIWPQVFIFQPDGTYEPNEDLAVAELTSEDPQTVTYTIDDAAVWSDGTPITADDFLFTWESQRADIDPATGEFVYNAASTSGFEIMDCVAEGDKVVTCTFSERYADWPGLFAPIMPRHAFEAEGNGDVVAAFNEGFKFPAIGTRLENVPSGGPWSISEINGETSVTLVRNEQYWGEPATLEEVVIRWITDPTTEPAALENGEVDVIFPQAQLDLVQQVDGVPNLEYLVGFGTFFEHIDFNFNNVHLAKSEVRQAIGEAIDRQQIVDRLPGQLSPDAEVMNHHIFYPGSAAYQPNGAELYGEQDIAAAQDLLEEAGYELGEDGIYSHPTDGRLSLRFVWRQPNPRREQSFALAQASLAEAGIELVPAPRDDFTFLDAGEYDVTIFGWTNILVPSGFTDQFKTDGAVNYGSYSNPDVDALFVQADGELDPEIRAELLNEIDVILWEDLPVLPLFQVPEFLAWDTSVQNVEMNGYDGFFYNAHTWGLAV
jgi:peptide/nickel transport system substrate-binding protein